MATEPLVIPAHVDGTPAALPAVKGATEFPEQDLTPERYRIKTRAFESDTEAVSTMTGVILAVRAARWLPVQPIGDPPLTQCELTAPGQGTWRREPDNPQGPVEPRACATCPMNQWGSNPGRRGKACREKRLLLVLRDGEALPVVVVAPPTSIRAVARFETRVAARELRLAQLHVRLTVQPVKHGSEEWGVLQIEELGRLEAADLGALVTRLQRGPLAEMYRAWVAPRVQSDAVPDADPDSDA